MDRDRLPFKADASRRQIDQVLERMKTDRRFANRVRKDPIVELAKQGIPILATVELLREEDGGFSEREVELLGGFQGLSQCSSTCSCTGCCLTCWRTTTHLKFGDDVINPGGEIIR